MSEKNKISHRYIEKNDEVDIGKLIGTLYESKWLILGVTCLFALIGVIYVIFATPVYKADALVQIEQKYGNALIDNINSILPNSKPASEAEIELIQSRMILGKTVSDENLDIIIQEKYFPVFGIGWARLIDKPSNEIAISVLQLPRELLNVDLNLKVIDKNSFELTDDDDNVLIRGNVATIAKGREGTAIVVSKIDAQPGTVFYIRKAPVLSVINQIKNNLDIEETGKDTGVLALTYLGEDRNLIQKTLNSITQNYLMQNIERKSEEAQKSLDFLKVEVPKVRSNLDIAEDKLNLYRQQNDTVDLPLEAKSVLDSLVNIDSQLNELTFKEAEISKLYTKEHPAYRTLLEKRQTLEEEKQRLNKRVTAMPKTQQEILRLTRDVQSGQELYMQLVNKQQEFNITRASTVADVRIIDSAVTVPGPIEPKKGMIIGASIFLGLLVSLFSVLIKTIMSRGIESPIALEEVGINVYASIPLSEWQQRKDKEIQLRLRGNRKIQSREILAVGNPTDLAIEAVRGLRTSLHFAMMEAKNKILMISGASPSIGKTFICTNLAVVIAQSDKRVLLIDGDMRKGYTHELLELDNSNGLSDVLSAQATFENAVKKTKISNFDIITRGQVPPNPSELLMSSRFESLLKWANEHYDLVIVDTPPILAVTDASLVAHLAGTSLLVVRYAENTLKEVEVSIDRFEKNGLEIKGVILNSVFKKASNQYGDYGYYHYDYKSSDK